MKHWLMKTEPNTYSIQDLKRDKTEAWDGVRNYQARNFMRDDMKRGDLVLFYHSNAKPAGVAGVATISKPSHPDITQFDKKSKYYDAKATPEEPRWYLVEVKFKQEFNQVVSLQDIKDNTKLQDMLVIKRGMRLSIQPVDKKHFDEILRMAKP